MATILEEFNELKLKIAAGRGNETVHIVWTDQERQRKRENKPKDGKKPQTKFYVDCGTPEIFRDLYTEYDRILSQIGNKTMALCIMVDWLRALTTERIQKKLSEGEHQQKEGGPPKAELPKWVNP